MNNTYRGWTIDIDTSPDSPACFVATCDRRDSAAPPLRFTLCVDSRSEALRLAFMRLDEYHSPGLPVDIESHILTATELEIREQINRARRRLRELEVERKARRHTATAEGMAAEFGYTHRWFLSPWPFGFDVLKAGEFNDDHDATGLKWEGMSYSDVDHPDFYIDGAGRPAAIVAHLTDAWWDTPLSIEERLPDGIRVTWPNRFESWHEPGKTRIAVYTTERQDPEQ